MREEEECNITKEKSNITPENNFIYKFKITVNFIKNIINITNKLVQVPGTRYGTGIIPGTKKCAEQLGGTGINYFGDNYLIIKSICVI